MRSGFGSKERLASGRWRVRASAGTNDDGSRRFVTRTVDTERDADLELARMAVELGKDPTYGMRAMTVGEYFDTLYLPSLEAQGLANGTVRLYTSSWNAHVRDRWRDVPLDEVRRQDVKRWLLSIPSAGGRNNAMKLLRQVLNAAMDDEIVDSHPMLRPIRLNAPLRAGAKPSFVWGPSELFACIDFLYTAPEKWRKLLPVVLAMAGGGLRREEAFALSRADMAFLRGPEGCTCLVSVSKAYTPKDGFKSAKNDQSVRVAVLADPFASMLDETCPEFGPIVPGAEWPLPLNPTRATVSWKSMFAENGGPLELPYIWLNQLRHTHETLYQSAGIGDALNSRAHGHSQLKTDYSHYLYPDLDAMIAAAWQMSRWITVS